MRGQRRETEKKTVFKSKTVLACEQRGKERDFLGRKGVYCGYFLGKDRFLGDLSERLLRRG